MEYPLDIVDDLNQSVSTFNQYACGVVSRRTLFLVLMLEGNPTTGGLKTT